jgi:tRNA wybutosine-synthesizing protein 4
MRKLITCSDSNPWQNLSRYPKACEDVTFIDVDYMSLMEKKRDMVRNTAELNTMLTNLSIPESGKVLLRSDQYLQIGCDLRDLSQLSAVLASAVDLEKFLVLFTAEVSITYMHVEAADALIKWAGTLSDGELNSKFI